MQFTNLHKLFFTAEDGAYSRVTEREVYDSQITLTDREADIVIETLGRENIQRGKVGDNPGKALTSFKIVRSATAKAISLNLVFPKAEKDELRLYLRKDSFKPEADQIWFLFVRDEIIHLGSMDEVAWRSIGRNDEDDSVYQDLVIKASQPKILTPEYQKTAATLIQKRNPVLAKERFDIAGFQCELSSECRLFTSRSSGKNYLEAHHFIPLAFQPFFRESLDRLENIVALCPFCHRAIHHADVDHTRSLIEDLMIGRAALFDQFDIERSDFYDFYNCEEIIAAS